MRCRYSTGLSVIVAFLLCGLVGCPPKKLPDVVGLPEADAVTALEALGLEVEVTDVYSDEVALGEVIGQALAPETRVDTAVLRLRSTRYAAGGTRGRGLAGL